MNALEKWLDGQLQPNGEITISIPALQTPEGLVMRRCPSEDCRPRQFHREAGGAESVVGPRCRRDPCGPGETCPYCGLNAADEDFLHPDDVAAATEELAWRQEQYIRNELKRMATEFNQQLGGGLLGLRMDVEPSRRPRPRAYRRDLLRVLACDQCARRYGVYAVALFCPACGAPNLLVHFEREQELVLRQLEIAKEAGVAGARELAYRLTGNAHEDVLTAVEANLKAVFRLLVQRRASAADTNRLLRAVHGKSSMQSVEGARKHFKKFGVDPFERMASDHLARFDQFIQMRHLFGHNLGLIDSAFLERTKRAGTEGEQVRVGHQEVAEFCELSRQVFARLDSLLYDLGAPMAVPS